jgi:hypothetical protein
MMQRRQCQIDRLVVELDQPPALAPVGLVDRVLDRGDGVVLRQDAGDGEEAGLHDGVDAPPHAGLGGDGVGVDHPQLQALVDDLAAQRRRQRVPYLVGRRRRVEQENAAGRGVL